MSDSSGGPAPLRPSDGDIAADAGEIASAGRSCLVILILGIAVMLVLCVGIAVRWATI